MVSIKDVAKLAGVSVMTASRALNGGGAVSAEARRRVLQASQKLNYRPNLNARSLRVKETRLIGLLLPDIENPLFASLAKHVEAAAGECGYSVMLGNTWENPAREAEYLELMLARQMDAIAVVPVSGDNALRFAACPAPLVVLDRRLEAAEELASVTVDNREIGALAARHLLSLGHRNFACIAGPETVPVFVDRLEGFRDELVGAGARLRHIARVESVGNPGHGAEAAEHLLSETPLPCALFCANDVIALGAIRAAHRLGLDVPGDVSVVGVDGIPAGELSAPPLTTVRQPVREMAEAGVELLLAMLHPEGEEARPERGGLRPELLLRESTGKFRSEK